MSADAGLSLNHSIATTATVIASAVKLTDQNSGWEMPRGTCALNQGTKPFDSSRKCARKIIGASRRILRGWRNILTPSAASGSMAPPAPASVC